MTKKLLWTLVFTVFAFGFARAQGTIEITGNGTVITDGQTTISSADNTDFGSTPVGTPVVHQFTINNTGTTTLYLMLPPALNDLGGGTADWSTTSPTFTVAPGASSSFDVTFNPSTLGTQTIEVSVTSSDAANSPYTFNIQGAGIQSTMVISGNSIPISNGDITPSVTDGTSFGSTPVGTPVTHQFTITNNNTTNLFVSLPPSINDLGTGTSDWSTTDPSFIIAPSSSSTFDVTFNPSTAGAQSVEISITSSDPTNDPYTFVIDGTGTQPSGPDIEITGNGTVITDGQTTISTSDNTDFGSTLVGTPVVRQFTVNNTGTSNLYLSLPPNINDLGTGTSDWSTTSPLFIVGPGASSTFDITFNPSTLGTQTVEVSVTSSDPDESPYTFNIQGVGIESTMVITGNGVPIANGDTSPDVADDTDFGSTPVGTPVVHQFTITNNNTTDLFVSLPPSINDLGTGTSDWSTTNPLFQIPPSSSSTFDITFNPSTAGAQSVEISISSSDPSNDPYTFVVSGTGIIAAPLLITQYYEGVGSQKWIEIKNISPDPVIGGNYSIALYDQTKAKIGTIETATPDATEPIGFMNPGDVILFRNNAATVPGNLGTANITASNVCNFDGNDVIIIYPSGSTTPYNDRLDIMGMVTATTPPFWGANISFTKGCGKSLVPTTVFNAATDGVNIIVGDYIRLETAEVDSAISDQNIALGTFDSNPTTWTTSWSNGTPDRTRRTVIDGTYTGSLASLETCDLTINSTLNFDNGTTNYVDVSGDLTINGSFVIGDTESLTFGPGNLNENAQISGAITKIDRSTSLTNINDYTYWSSPVQTTINNIFNNGSHPGSMADLSTVYYWNAGALYSYGGYDFIGNWELASGGTIAGKGFISKGPSSASYPTQHELFFTGAPYNGSITLSGSNMIFVNDGDTDDDYNLVGNPYPSAIDADEFLGLSENQSTIDGTVYFWTHNTANMGGEYNESDYVSYNYLGGSSSGVTSNIGSSQGFMVRTISGGTVIDAANQIESTEVNFTNSMRLKDQNTQFYRGVETKSAKVETADKDRMWLKITSSTGGASDELLVGFVDKATDGFDRGYDGLKNSAGWISFYSVLDSLPYAIQGLSSFDLNKKVTLGFETYIAEPLSYTISIDAIEGVLKDNDVYLVDNELGLVHDLNQSPYTFDDEGYGYFPQRFTLQFTKSTLGVEDLKITDNDFIIINNENDLNIRSKGTITDIKMYDLMGRLLIEKAPNDTDFNISTANIRKGTILLLNATFENGAEMKKKTIRY